MTTTLYYCLLCAIDLKKVVAFNYGVSSHGVFIYITTVIDKTEPPQILYVGGINCVVNEPPALPGDD